MEDIPDEYYLNIKWAEEYTQFLKAKDPKKDFRQIDNEVLLDSNKNLKSNISEKHYVLLNCLAWNFIKNIYGGGPEIKKGILNNEIFFSENYETIIKHDFLKVIY